MDASLIVVLQGGAEQALRCFAALAALPEQPAHEVIVVDDASVGLEPLLERLGGDVTVVRTERRSGFAAAANLGASNTQGRVLVLLRGAPAVAHGWLAPLVDALEDAGVAAAASASAGEPGAHPVTAHALAVRREQLEAVGGLPLVGEALAFGALAIELAGDGRLEMAPGSLLNPPGTRTTGARRAPGEEVELSVVVPTLDATSERVMRCVTAVQATTDVPYEIVLIDNGAPPQGFTAPVNAGVRAASGRYVVVMNDDVEPLPGWWPPLRAALDRGEAVAFPLTEGVMRLDFAAWCFALARDEVAEIGHSDDELFDPRFRVWYQDTDLLERLRALGRPPALVEGSRIRHGLSETVASEDPALSAWIRSEIERDMALFRSKHAGVKEALARADS